MIPGRKSKNPSEEDAGATRAISFSPDAAPSILDPGEEIKSAGSRGPGDTRAGELSMNEIRIVDEASETHGHGTSAQPL